MKKYTNKILIAMGIILLICNITFISCSLDQYVGSDSDTYDMYDEDYYYDEDDYIIDEEQY